jgi:hypothetical protein
MVEVGIAEYFSIGEAIGIIGTMFVVLYFSRKHMQRLTLDVKTKVLNDLDEKVRKMAEIIIEKPSMQKVIYRLEKPAEELAFAYYILFICSHAYTMRQRKVLDDDEWTGWLHWMKNCFKYGTIGEQWEQIQSERWFNPDFENFLNENIIPRSADTKQTLYYNCCISLLTFFCCWNFNRITLLVDTLITITMENGELIKQVYLRFLVVDFTNTTQIGNNLYTSLRFQYHK